MSITLESSASGAAPSAGADVGARIAGIDLLRGLVILLMALDHTRDYFHVGGFGVNPLDPAQTTPLLYLTRWVTHLCAPTFVFLAGVSAYLQGWRGKPTRELSLFLAKRGLWLIALEATVISFGWSFGVPWPLFLQVIWAIGWSMLALAALVWLPRTTVLAIGIAIIALHNLLDPISAKSLGAYRLFWVFLHDGGLVMGPGGPIGVASYPILPWVGIIAFGYGLGSLFTDASATRVRRLALLGFAMLAAFLVLRGFEAYGNPVPVLRGGASVAIASWHDQPTPMAQAMHFLDVQKYPPSLQFTLVTLGAVFALWPLLVRLRGPLASFLGTFGAVPFFFYLVHVYLIHLLAIAANAATGRDVAGLFNFLLNNFSGSPLLKNLGFPLWGVYLAWLAVIALMYFPCRYWQRLKERRRDWWLSYL